MNVTRSLVSASWFIAKDDTPKPPTGEIVQTDEQQACQDRDHRKTLLLVAGEILSVSKQNDLAVGKVAQPRKLPANPIYSPNEVCYGRKCDCSTYRS